MNSRPIIQGKKLRIYLDSESIANLLDNKDNDTKKLLNWIDTYNQCISDSDNLPQEIWTNYAEFLRSPPDSSYDSLNNVKSYEFKSNEEDYHEFEIRYGKHTFSHEMTELKCKHLLNDVKSDMLKKITSLMINFYEFSIRETEESKISNRCIIPALTGCLSENTNLLVTTNKHLLKNRLKLEKSLMDRSYFSKYTLSSNYPLNIVNVAEVNEIIDLFLKYRNLYFFGIEKFPFPVRFPSQNKIIEGIGKRDIIFDEYNWYLTSFRTKIPYHHAKNGLFVSFGNRFIFLLMCIDEMGKLYYQGANENTQMGLLYNFNYFISLMTGIFDNLALMTKEKYNISKEKAKISLNPNRGDLIVELKDKDLKLYNNIQDHVDFLKLIYDLRNEIVHSEMLDIAFLNSKDIKSNALILNDEIFRYFLCYPKKINKTKRLDFWGVKKINVQGNEKYLIEPFNFSKKATKILIDFSNTYLKLLGNSNFIEEFMEKWKGSSNQHYYWINDFEKFNLGY